MITYINEGEKGDITITPVMDTQGKTVELYVFDYDDPEDTGTLLGSESGVAEGESISFIDIDTDELDIDKRYVLEAWMDVDTDERECVHPEAGTDHLLFIDDRRKIAPELDTKAPTPTLSSATGQNTNDDPIIIVVSWSEAVTGFTQGDITVSNATVANFVENAADSYTVELSPVAEGQVTASIAEGVCEDLNGNDSKASNQLTFTYDNTAPTVSIASDSTTVTNDSPVTATITFSEAVEDFVEGDLVLGNCTAQNFVEVSDSEYTVELVPDGQGEFTLDVPAGVCQDAAGNDNEAATQFTRTYDTVSPTAAITSTASDPTTASPIPMEVAWSEIVSGFAEEDLDVVGGTVSNFSTADNQTWTFDITPDSDSEQITVDIPADIAIDDAGNPNSAAPQFSITYDASGPVATISSSAGTATDTSPIPIEIDWNENVIGFTMDDITVGNATLQNFVQVAGDRYTVEAVPDGDPVDVTIDIAAGVCEDELGNDNVEASQFTITYDSTAPSPTITSSESDPTNANPVPFEVSWSEDVQNFTENDLTVAGGSVSDFTQVNASTYTFNVTPASDSEEITVDIAADVCEDLNGVSNTAATQFAITYDGAGDKPVITSSEDQYTQADPIPLTITFPEAQNGFTAGDITVGNGTVDNFVDQGGGVYTCNLNPTANGACTIDIAGGKCTDQAGNDNVAADQFVIFHDTAAPTVSDASLNVDPITTDGGTVNWTRATDAVSDQEDLVYELWSSLSDNITSISDAQNNGTLEDSDTHVNNLDVTGKNDGDEVWIKVLCKDQAGNILGYTTTSFIVNDGIAPTIPSPGISTEEVGEHTFDMVFQEAEDNITVHANMKYHGYTSEEDNLNSVADAEANGTYHGFVTGALRITCDGLITDTPYYGQIVAEDEGGNKSIYDVVQQRTAKFGDAVLSQAQIFP